MVDARRLSFTTRKISYRYWFNPCDNSRGVGAASEGEPHKNSKIGAVSDEQTEAKILS